MEERLIEFETAKFAKEKGFDVPCWDYFIQEDFENCSHIRENHNLMNDVYSRPSQSLLQKWLRESYGINILISPTQSNGDPITYQYCLHYKYGAQSKMTPWSINKYHTYELAIEEGLKESLKLI